MKEQIGPQESSLINPDFEIKHREMSALLYNGGKTLLDKYGEVKSRLSLHFFGEKYGNRLENVSFRKTPPVLMNVEGKEVDVSIREDFTTDINCQKKMDKIVIEIYDLSEALRGSISPGEDLFTISETRKETTHSGKEATPEQLLNAVELFMEIGKQIETGSKNEVKA